MSDFEPNLSEIVSNHEFIPKEHFLLEAPKDVSELRLRLLSALDGKEQGWLQDPQITTSKYLFDYLGERDTTIPLKDVVGWTYFNNISNFLQEDRSDGRGINHVMDIIRGWNGEKEDSYETMGINGLTFISNEPGKYILYEGKHRFLAAIAMGIPEIPAKCMLYSRKTL